MINETRLTGYINGLKEIIKNGDPLAIKDAQDKVDAIKGKIANIEASLAAKNNDITSQKSVITTASEAVGSIETEVETLKRELNELNKRPAKAEYDKVKEKTQLAEESLNDKVTELKANLSPAQIARINAQSADNQPAELVTVMNEILNSFNAQKNVLNNDLAQANNDLANAENDIRDKETALADATARLKALSGTIDEATTALENAKAELESKKAIEADKQKAVDDATTKLNALNAELTALQDELKDIEDSITDKTAQNAAILAVIKDKEDKLVELNKINDKVIEAENKFDDARADLKTKEETLETKKQELADTISAITENTENLDKFKTRALVAAALDRNNADTYADFPEVKAAIDAYNKALADVEDAKKALADATTDRDVANEEYQLAMAELKESKFRYDRALADYNRLKPVEVRRTAKIIKKNVGKSPKTGDETALLANMGILALAGYAATKAKKRKSNK